MNTAVLPDRTLTLLIGALGGEGGGVLAARGWPKRVLRLTRE